MHLFGLNNKINVEDDMKETIYKKILDIFIKNEHVDYITAGEIATYLECSDKTVRNNIKKLNKIFKDNGAEIISRPRYGYRLEIKDQNLYEEFLKDKWHIYAFEKYNYNDPDYRIRYILKVLLLTNFKIDRDDFADELYLSLSQVNNDLLQVEKIIGKYDLDLFYDKNYIFIKGSEKNKRRCISNEVYINYLSDKHPVDDDYEIVNRIGELTYSVLKANSYEISHFNFNNLIIHLYVSIKRIKSNDCIEDLHIKNVPLITDKSYLIAEQLCEKLSDEYDISFSKNEKDYIRAHLISKEKYVYNTIIDKEIDDLVKEMINLIYEKYKLDFRSDFNLRISLASHIGPLLDRLRYGLEMTNPLLEEIKKDVIAYNLASTSMSVINDKYDLRVSENEIGFIGLHFSVAFRNMEKENIKKNIILVCGTGGGIAEIMKYQLKKQFKDSINIVGCYDVFSLEERDLSDVDLIVTSVGLDIKLDIPIVEVSVFLSDWELDKLKDVINRDRCECNYLNCYFQQELFFRGVDLSSITEVFKFIDEEVRKKKNIFGNLYEQLQKREDLAPTSFSPCIAIPHPLNSVSDEDFGIVIILDKPIYWSGKYVSLIIGFCFSNKRLESDKMEDFFTTIGDFLTDDNRINKALEAKNINEFKNIVNIKEKKL